MNQIKPLDQVLPIGADAHNHVTKVVNKFGSRDSILYKLKEFSSSVPDFRRSDQGIFYIGMRRDTDNSEKQMENGTGL